MRFSTVNDFIGEINLDLSNDVNVLAQFDAFATQIETDILRDLLNDKLYTDFIADLTNNVPASQKFIDLLDGKTYQMYSTQWTIFEGLKRMLRYFIYEAYLDSQYSVNTSVGQMNGQNENAISLNRSNLRKVRANIQNKAVGLYNKAAQFINENYTDYFTGNDYNFWQPAIKRYLGKITSSTYNNSYFYNRSSKGN